MLTMQELRAWHMRCAATALGQARLRISSLRDDDGGASVSIAGQVDAAMSGGPSQ